MIEAVIFDWDGTLADTKNVVVQSFQKVFKESGCEVSDEFIERRMGIGTKKTIIQAFRECSMRLNVSKLERLVEEKIKIQTELIDTVCLFDGAVELLETLKDRIKIGLATMSSRKVIEKVLSDKKIKYYFDIVVSADDVTNPKPNPEVFLVTAEKLRADPRYCLVFEDSVFGVRAAKDAKMQCVAVSSGVWSKEELMDEKPDMVIDSLAEKNKILSFIFAK